MPMTALSGVRISWLIVARNMLLARLAASAASLEPRSSMVRACTVRSRLSRLSASSALLRDRASSWRRALARASCTSRPARYRTTKVQAKRNVWQIQCSTRPMAHTGSGSVLDSSMPITAQPKSKVATARPAAARTPKRSPAMTTAQICPGKNGLRIPSPRTNVRAAKRTHSMPATHQLIALT